MTNELNVAPNPEGIEKVRNLEEENGFLDNNALKLQKQNLGWLGVIAGNNEEKAGNTAFITILISFALITCITFLPRKHEDTSIDRLLLIPSSFITLSLGYLFGKK